MRVVSRAEAMMLVGCEAGWAVENMEDANVGDLVVQRLAEVCERLCKEVLGSACLERCQAQARAWGVQIPVWSGAWSGCWGEACSRERKQGPVRL